jgi:hypothetical protein
MNDTRLVGSRKSVGNLDCYTKQICKLHRPLSRQVTQRMAINVFHDNESLSGLTSYVMYCNDVWVVQRRSSAGLQHKATAPVGWPILFL